MPVAFNLIFDPSLAAVVVPAPGALNLAIDVQAATAEEMTANVRKALADVAARNVEIVANPNLGPAFKLEINDVILAGAGDGHTFVTTLQFAAHQVNGLLIFLEALQFAATDLGPEFWDFEFALAGEGAALDALYTPLWQALINASTAKTGQQAEEVIGIFDLSAGGAKGTRFMVGMGAIIDQPVVNALARGAVALDQPRPSPIANAQSLISKLRSARRSPAIASPVKRFGGTFGGFG